MTAPYVGSINGGYTGSGTSRNFPITLSGTNLTLVFNAWTRSSGANAITGITFDGNAMTPLGTEVTPANNSGAEYIQQWAIQVPVGSGTSKNITVSCPSGMELICSAAYYSDAGFPDVSSNQPLTVSTNTTCSINTVTDDSVAVVLYRDAGGAGSAGTNATFRVYGLSSSGTGCYETTVAKTPPGTLSLVVNHSNEENGYQMCTIPPYSAPAPSGNSGFLQFM